MPLDVHVCAPGAHVAAAARWSPAPPWSLPSPRCRLRRTRSRLTAGRGLAGGAEDNDLHAVLRSHGAWGGPVVTCYDCEARGNLWIFPLLIQSIGPVNWISVCICFNPSNQIRSCWPVKVAVMFGHAEVIQLKWEKDVEGMASLAMPSWHWHHGKGLAVTEITSLPLASSAALW